MKVTVVLIIGSLEIASQKASKEELETNKEESITKIIKSSWILKSVLEEKTCLFLWKVPYYLRCKKEHRL